MGKYVQQANIYGNNIGILNTTLNELVVKINTIKNELSPYSDDCLSKNVQQLAQNIAVQINAIIEKGNLSVSEIMSKGQELDRMEYNKTTEVMKKQNEKESVVTENATHNRIFGDSRKFTLGQTINK